MGRETSGGKSREREIIGIEGNRRERRPIYQCLKQDERFVRPNIYVSWLSRHTQPTSCAAILQRVLSASVTVDKEVVSSIGRGILVLAAIAPGDTEKEAESLAAKVLKMKLWDDETGGRV